MGLIKAIWLPFAVVAIHAAHVALGVQAEGIEQLLINYGAHARPSS